MTVALGVIAYRDAPALRRLLATALGYDEVLVANITADPGVETAAADHGARTLVIPQNVGFAGGVNAVARAATSAWVLIVNDDVTLGAHSSDACREAAAGDDPVVVPALCDESGVRRRSLLPIASPGRVLAEWVLLPDRGPRRLGRWVQKWREPEAGETVAAAIGAAVLVRTDLLRAVPMDERYFLYWEEIDWYWRLQDLSITARYAPAVTILRSGGANELGRSKWWWMGRNLVELGRTRYGALGAALYLTLALVWCARLAVTDAAAGNRLVRWRARRAAACGALAAATGRAPRWTS